MSAGTDIWRASTQLANPIASFQAGAETAAQLQRISMEQQRMNFQAAMEGIQTAQRQRNAAIQQNLEQQRIDLAAANSLADNRRADDQFALSKRLTEARIANLNRPATSSTTGSEPLPAGVYDLQGKPVASSDGSTPDKEGAPNLGPQPTGIGQDLTQPQQGGSDLAAGVNFSSVAPPEPGAPADRNQPGANGYVRSFGDGSYLREFKGDYDTVLKQFGKADKTGRVQWQAPSAVKKPASDASGQVENMEDLGNGRYQDTNGQIFQRTGFYESGKPKLVAEKTKGEPLDRLPPGITPIGNGRYQDANGGSFIISSIKSDGEPILKEESRERLPVPDALLKGIGTADRKSIGQLLDYAQSPTDEQKIEAAGKAPKASDGKPISWQPPDQENDPAGYAAWQKGYGRAAAEMTSDDWTRGWNLARKRLVEAAAKKLRLYHEEQPMSDIERKLGQFIETGKAEESAVPDEEPKIDPNRPPSGLKALLRW